MQSHDALPGLVGAIFHVGEEGSVREGNFTGSDFSSCELVDFLAIGTARIGRDDMDDLFIGGGSFIVKDEAAEAGLLMLESERRGEKLRRSSHQ